MVLQTRYFRLLDVSSVPHKVALDDIAREVPVEIYRAEERRAPAKFARAHEVAFDAKGTPSCNLSV